MYRTIVDIVLYTFVYQKYKNEILAGSEYKYTKHPHDYTFKIINKEKKYIYIKCDEHLSHSDSQYRDAWDMYAFIYNNLDITYKY